MTAGHCQIEKEIRPFVACKSRNCGAVGATWPASFLLPGTVGEEYPALAPDENRQRAGRGAGSGRARGRGRGAHAVATHPGRPSIPIADSGVFWCTRWCGGRKMGT